MTKIDTKKKRDTRTHDEKITALRDAFERLKARASALGNLNECSIRKVCEKANVSNSYLHTARLKDEAINKRYHSVKDDIVKFRKTFKDSTTQSELGLAIVAKETMETERDEAHVQFRASRKEISGLKNRLKIANDKLQAQNYLAVDIAHSNLQSQNNQKNQFSITSEPRVVSPDAHLYKDGNYSYTNPNIRDAAWRTARHEFEEFLKRKLPTRVYVLVGAPCSGKSYWSKQSNYYNDMHTLVVDATNLTKSDRTRWFSLIYKHKHQIDIKVCAVFFDTPYVVLMERNNKRPPDKRLSDEDLQDKFNNLEPVDVFEDFDEIMVVRHG
ncbi:hypothetical protein [Pseudoalteromonas denitrificans]|uniref:AAA domain-containing protein n=1 Tax=Pseudoalteromonas denitrificans DSM 6059 TaxID=1123010 RepID=A0A1I1IL31_9GAMM|nr:hypothetical protein [Pseudoalteromonas denitrificans]SFC37039.1 hypothetical protein SAMN02745724_01524 [Pseudoalteromonas denitrificans DSM 6059]